MEYLEGTHTTGKRKLRLLDERTCGKASATDGEWRPMALVPTRSDKARLFLLLLALLSPIPRAELPSNATATSCTRPCSLGELPWQKPKKLHSSKGAAVLCLVQVSRTRRLLHIFSLHTFRCRAGAIFSPLLPWMSGIACSQARTLSRDRELFRGSERIQGT